MADSLRPVTPPPAPVPVPPRTYAETVAAMDTEIAEAVAVIERRWLPVLRKAPH